MKPMTENDRIAQLESQLDATNKRAEEAENRLGTTAQAMAYGALVKELDASKAEVERLRARVERLREALKPFAEAELRWWYGSSDIVHLELLGVSEAHIEAAQAALKEDAK